MLFKIQPILSFKSNNYALVHSDDSCYVWTEHWRNTDSRDLRSTINTHV